MSFKNSYQVGKQFASENIDQFEQEEQVIFLAMENNPYKSEKTREEFIRGVSDWSNMIGRIKTHKMVYGNSGRA